MESRQGLDDNVGRGRIFQYVLAALSAKRPRAFLLENVKGLVSQQRATFDDMLQQLRRLGKGAYKVGCQITDTARHGILQHRERVYIVGLLRDYIVPCCFKTMQVPGVVRSAWMSDRRQQAEYVSQGPPQTCLP
ncbi:MAG: DNA cytosine methyltransferase, partial [Candidatus Fonsibacter sp.]